MFDMAPNDELEDVIQEALNDLFLLYVIKITPRVNSPCTPNRDSKPNQHLFLQTTEQITTIRKVEGNENLTRTQHII